MPVFEGLVSRLCEKLEEVRISELNHELGKAKENFLSDLSLIRSESVHRIGGLFFQNQPSLQKHIPKSASLPVFPGEKYKYRSCNQPIEEEIEEEAQIDEDVVSKFIQVVESPSPRLKRKKAPQNSREEILKKLAFSSEERSNETKRNPELQNNKDLEVCYINKTISEGDNEDEDLYLNPNQELSSDEEEKEDSDVFPTSRSDWERIRNPDLSTPPSPSKGPSYREEKAKARFAKQIRKLQKEARTDLENCRRIAKRKINSEKQKRSADNPLTKLGIQEESLKSEEGLSTLNLATLQVVVNNNHSQIQAFNEELVQLLLEKDELSIEQEGQLLDIEDLTLNVQGT
ncbi:schwannomin-interacting protein 1 [Lepeophtheirus salmonis]|uniref:schwannomin-interacting protein 1 n=1 Tax=Lepeophtheirus salmonis TaxID=72036 RepID=UPI001AE5058F|nr:schwannomin-interacting protein 1-like [Lepeophtheirus salmonis]